MDILPAPKKNKDLVKEFGDAAFILGSELSQHTNEILHVSPRIDLLLGGGIPGGSVVTLAGDSLCGKTVTALRTSADQASLLSCTLKNTMCSPTESEFVSKDCFGLSSPSLSDLQR